MAVSAMKDRFQLNTSASVNTLVGKRTDNFLLIETLEMWVGRWKVWWQAVSSMWLVT